MINIGIENLESNKTWILQGYYHVIKVLEELNYSTVYYAKDLEKGTEEYAIKEVKLHYDDKESLRKIMRNFEKTILGYMDIFYPYLTNISDFFFEDGYEYIVMRFVPGRRLQEIINVRQKPFEEKDVIDIGIMIGSALQYLHTKIPPIYFADLFPSNIIITPNGTLELTDYGLGKALAKRPVDDPFRGTKGYAPPEQYGFEPTIDARSDLYSLGAVLHQLITGRHPASFEGRLPHVRDINPSVDNRLNDIIYNLTEPKRSSRFKTATEFIREITNTKEEKPEKSNMKLWLSRILSRRKFKI